ncbi:SMI1/KNR4 family protein [Jeotgalibaca sp. A122]|uniref:SMI1/KNR4 family protein n=1 Tax=Jeotgalibaca sp. A122 TaxID=3457322 RepID=UPI003FCF3A57
MASHLIPTASEKNLNLLLKKRPLTSTLTTADLPESYLQLLTEQNGGYVKNMVVPTQEPTSDGLDCAHLHYILGLHENKEKSLPYQDFLPDYFIIFSSHKGCYFTFDYSRGEVEPAIRYLDTETDNWQVVASNFTAFLSNLRPGKITVPFEGQLTRTEAEHAFLTAGEPDELDVLWAHLEDTDDKEWYFDWIQYFAQIPMFHQSAFGALETQILYFRLDLPQNADKVFKFFPEKSDWIQEELAADF